MGLQRCFKVHVHAYLHCSYLPSDSRKEKKDTAKLKIEENRGQPHMSDSDNESGSDPGGGNRESVPPPPSAVSFPFNIIDL